MAPTTFQRAKGGFWFLALALLVGCPGVGSGGSGAAVFTVGGPRLTPPPSDRPSFAPSTPTPRPTPTPLPATASPPRPIETPGPHALTTNPPSFAPIIGVAPATPKPTPTPSPSGSPGASATPTSPPTTAPSATPTPTPTANANAPATGTIHITGLKFVPDTFTLKMGGTITWINDDATLHTATPIAGAEFSTTGNIQPKGTSQPIVFNTVKNHPYRCEFHPEMLGTIIVVP